ncbi:flagellar protein FlgN [Lysobacter sp. LF1]|uniref:Flagellar protein FlgN n=1 Tax=Lysobacter stagni TaxID=3045172 RepID=A0ABT6XB92_9GAMM|nr:flagellar protein FlgN [Lysobacter sp. LF1]MDI9237404.1 flagellar protein FlgN [Lysobacter sp. LF1]
MSEAAVHPLEALERALHEERRALLEHDVDALLVSTQAKLVALRQAEAVSVAAGDSQRVIALSELNQANGALLARRRREVNWSLRHLGRLDADSVYDASGQSGAKPQARCLGVG